MVIGDISLLSICNRLASNKICEAVHEEKWKNVFHEDYNENILMSITDDKIISDDIHKQIANIIKNFIVESEECHMNISMLGVSCLKLFVQENWTGPPLTMEDNEIIYTIMKSKTLNDAALFYYESRGDDLYQFVSYPILLLVANIILVDMMEFLHLYPVLILWGVKFLAAFLQVLIEVKEEQLKAVMLFYQKGKDLIGKMPDLSKEIHGQFLLESSHLLLKCYDYSRAQECLDQTSVLLGVQVSLSSSLGKRTKFQMNNLPQMKLDVVFDKDRNQVVKTQGESTKDLPTNVVLDNDTLLPEIKFIDGESAKSTDLSAIEQAYVISNCVHLRKARPRDDLSYEELLPYADSVLLAPQSWSVQYKALFLRCITEFNNSRKAERALQQLEELINSFKKKTPEGVERYMLAHSVDLQPRWEHERSYAQLLFSIGCVDSALEIFIRLSMWDDVIGCYQRLGKHGKAEEVIRSQLAIRETATLWCLLGDATLDKEHYEKAWEFSKQRSSRSQKSLGFWYLRRKEFAASIPYFEKSLDLNCLQPDAAFSLGCACMATKDLEKGAKSFQKSVGMEPDSYEAWNNLASCFIRLGQLSQAYKALQQATRLSFNSWKLWENFMLVCTDIGAFEDSIHCVHRLVDLGRKEIDTQVLQILVKASIDGEKDVNNLSATRLKPRIQKMFGHVTSSITSSSRIWELYAWLCLSNDNNDENEKALQFLYKSHRCFTQHTDWEKEESKVPNVMRVTMKMLEVTKLVCSNITGQDARVLSLKSTTKMAINNLIIRLKKAFVNEENNNVSASTVESIKVLEDRLLELTVEIENM